MKRAACLCLLVCAVSAHAEDGYDLWLRYRPIEAPWAAQYRSFATEVVAAPAASIAAQELMRGMPKGYAPPQHSLAEYEAISTPYAPGNPGWTAAPFRH